jgi:hypothetical protein
MMSNLKDLAVGRSTALFQNRVILRHEGSRRITSYVRDIHDVSDLFAVPSLFGNVLEVRGWRDGYFACPAPAPASPALTGAKWSHTLRYPKR